MKSCHQVCVFSALFLAFASGAATQCATDWVPGSGVPGLHGLRAIVGPVHAVSCLTRWDPDGPGPQPTLIVAGGRFGLAGDQRAYNVAAWNDMTGTWSALGASVNGRVWAIVVMPNRDLVVAGEFTMADGAAVNRIARWDGTSWSPLGTGMDRVVYALTVQPNGDLVAGGRFLTAGNTSASGIARWNGSSWSALGAGVSGVGGNAQTQASSLATLPNGDVIVGGRFSMVGSTVVQNIARWDGAAWFAMAAGIGSTTSGYVSALMLLPSGELVASGGDSHASSLVLRWNGTAWSALGTGMDAGVDDMVTMANGDILACGRFETASGVPVDRLARWDGTVWSTLATGWSSVGSNTGARALVALPNGGFIAGGGFRSVGGIPVSNLARWHNGTWDALGSGSNGAVRELVTLPNGEVLAGGDFGMIGGVVAPSVARWNGASWSAIGTANFHKVESLAALPNGDIVVGGFRLGSMDIASWDGSSWTQLATGLDGLSRAMVIMPNGDLVAGGAFNLIDGVSMGGISRWNGTTWSALGDPLLTSGSAFTAGVHAVAVLANGDLVVGGDFAVVDGAIANRVARWNGVSWSPMGTGTNGGVLSLVVTHGGELVAGGAFTAAGGSPANHVARWNGTSWSAMATGLNGLVHALEVLPNGDVVAGGSFSNARMERWNGSSWAPMGGGTNDLVAALTMSPASGLFVGGDFSIAGGEVSAFIAQIATNCLATVDSSGAGCASSGGANTLSAWSLPWVGSTFRSYGTGLPQAALVLALLSHSTTLLPLASVFPEGQSGCNLLVAPDVVDLMLSNAGTADYEWVVPNSSAIAGVVVHHQMVLAEFHGLGAITAITATNALQLTIGTF